ncbi:PepSY-associated TM helix domain-containing protein [Salinicola sp. JS01]|uniref:PepSY-associated TM helix domain-containing protein n=1 Tax=Salinicola sp. JS01 TaxID=3050071 RepID=UPI00255B81EF|nr:PepSY-associated TM helix domain-containing protein [Salinicola sp. JS01]WIX32324.1 PepSY-associated TM helix domain-containing protein [Salinicola sp. JS01]
MTTSNRPLLLALHGGAGALFGVVLFVVLFSGAWSLGHEALNDWLRPPSQTASTSMTLERVVARAREAGIDTRHVSIVLPSAERAAFRVCDARLNCQLTLDAHDGRRLNDIPSLDILLTLHKSLFIGFPGRVLISLSGVALFVLCVAGVLLHGRRWRELWRWRRDRGLRLALFDLHGLIGLWGLPWLLLFSLTGALSGLGALGTLLLAPVAYPEQPRQVFAALMGAPPPAAVGRPLETRVDLDALLVRDAARSPGFVAQRLTLVHADDVAGSVEVAGIQRGLPSSANFERHRYRLADGTLLEERSSAQRGAWLRAFIAVQPLHFARYQWLGPGWSAVLRGLHLTMGLGACLLCATGLYLWLQRRRAASAARVTLLLHLSQGVCAGLVTAAALLLLALQLLPQGMLGGPWPSRLFFGVWFACVLAALVPIKGWTPMPWLLGSAGLACLAAVILHLGLWLAHGRLPALGPDVTLLCCGVLLTRHVWTQTRAARSFSHSRVIGDHHV